jgi:hypothetical protein
MACPYFYPVARFESSPWDVPPRLPLGDAFSGECRAPGMRMAPDATRQREICNVGYGRYGCEQFPRESRADAIRFHVANQMDAGGQELIQIQYILEKDCWPVEQGMVDGSAHETLRRQAEVFAEVYLRRRSEA